jgi:sigma-E factor negative regulatory protein RseA
MSSTHRTGRPVQAEADLELLSAWLDGELEPDQASAMVSRLKGESRLRVKFEGFNVVGDALRSHEVAACHCPALAGKVSRALESEPALLAPTALLGSKVRRHIATGVTVAAAAAMLAVVALPQLRGSDGAPAAPAAAVATASRAAAPGAVAVAVPNALPARSPQLDAYFRAHRELATTGVMPSAVAYIRMSGEPDR